MIQFNVVITFYAFVVQKSNHRRINAMSAQVTIVPLQTRVSYLIEDFINDSYIKDQLSIISFEPDIKEKDDCKVIENSVVEEIEKEKIEEEFEKNGVVIVKVVKKRQIRRRQGKPKKSLSKILQYENPGRLNLPIHERRIRTRKKPNLFSNSTYSKI